MKKSRILAFQLICCIVIAWCANYSYAAVSATISATPSNKNVEKGKTVTVTLALKNVSSNNKVESVKGYINYNKNIIDEITVDSIHKSSSNTITIGDETLKVEDLTNGSVSKADSYIAFNGKPTSKNDSLILIDFAGGVSTNSTLIQVDFKIKPNASLGTFENAITYSSFVLTTENDESNPITEQIDLTIVEASQNENTVNNTTVNNTANYNTVNNATNHNTVNNTTRNNTVNNTVNRTNNNTVNNATYYNVVNNTTKNNTVNNTVNRTNNNTVNNTTNRVNNNTVNNTTNKTNNNTVNNTTRNNTVNNTVNRTNNNTTNNSTNQANKSNSNSDNSVTGKKMPSTGAKLIIVPAIIVVVLAYISYNKYIKYKGI